MGGTVNTTNGRPVDLAAPSSTQVTTRDAPPTGELGSEWSGERLFQRYDNGKVFSTPWYIREDDLDDMLRMDGKARALEAVLTLPIRQAAWHMEPADGDRGEYEFCTDALTRPANAGGMSTPVDLVIGQMTSAVLFRRAFFEKVYRVADDGRVSFDKLAFRPARTCWLARDAQTNAFRGFQQRFRRGDDYVTVDIPAEKSFVYLHGTHRDPLNGLSDLETAYACYLAKQKVRFLWFSFLENQTIPKAVARHSNNEPREQQDFAKKVATLKGGGVVGIGPDQDVTAFESSGTAGALFHDAMRYLDGEASGSVLAGFTDLASAAGSGRGSFALSKDQSDFFLMSRQAVLGEMAAALVNWVLADLVRWNFGVGGAVPKFAFAKLTQGDAAAAISLLQALATNQSPNPPVPREFIDQLTVQVATLLDLDTDKVSKALADAQSSVQGPGAQLRAGIDAAAQLVARAGVAGVAPGAQPAPVAS